ncbi:hypothetical protein ABH925_005094 [Streptacidiphilus sp. EB129]
MPLIRVVGHSASMPDRGPVMLEAAVPRAKSHKFPPEPVMTRHCQSSTGYCPAWWHGG